MPRYRTPLILLHWLMAALMVGAYILGEVMDDDRAGGGLLDATGWHVLMGLLTGALVLPRLLLRRWGSPPPLPETAALERAAARWAHAALYGIMILLPVTGLTTVLAGRRPVPVLGLFDLPAAMPLRWLQKAAEEVHEFAATTFLVLLGLHVAAALWHALIRRDGSAGRMLPFGRR